MSTKEFGTLVEEELPDFGTIIEEEPPSQRRIASIGRAAAKGLLDAAISGPEVLSPMLLFSRGPLTPEQQRQSLMKLIGEPEEGFAEKLTERTAATLPFLLMGPGGIAAKGGRALLSSLLGQLTEEAGGGGLAQLVAEGIGLGVPGFGKKIIPTKAQERGIEMLRRRGVGEKEIAPLVPSERKISFLGKIGARGFRSRRAARRTREALGNIYGQLAQEGEKLPILSSNRAQVLQNQLESKLEKMPSSVRRSIQSDMQDLFARPVKANDLMNFWQDLNSQINWKKIGGGKRRLNELKDVLFEGLEAINPKLANEFELTNEFYSTFNNTYKNLYPTHLDRWIALGEIGGILGTLFKYGPAATSSILGAEVSRRLATEMIINPRLQNLTRQMTTALKKNRIGLAAKIQNKMQQELKRQDIDLPIPSSPEE